MDVDQTKEQLVIEGLITDSLKNHSVKLSTSNGLYDKNGFSKVDNAEVRVFEINPDGSEKIYLYRQENRPGQYFSEDAFKGLVGSRYRLEVVWNSETYEAEDVLLPVTAIDSLSIEPVDDDFEPWDALIDSLGTETGPFYWLKFYAYEPPNRVDYYTWKFYRNGVLKNSEGREVFYASDEIVQENIKGIFLPGTYTTGDTIYMEQFSLSRIGYLFYYDLETIINSDGGMFGPPPANPRNNLSNNALGFWQVSSVAHIELIIP